MIDHTSLTGPIASLEVVLNEAGDVQAPQWARYVYVYSTEAASVGGAGDTDLFPVPAAAGLRLPLRGEAGPAKEQAYRLSAGTYFLLYVE